jgi:YggT family protein
MALVGTVLAWFVTVAIALTFARWLLDLVARLRNSGPRPHRRWWALAFELVYVVTDPPLRFLRRHVPAVRVKGVSFDLSFLVLTLTLFVASGYVALI